MKHWWLVAAAAALVAVWWLRRGKAAVDGTAKTTPAPAGTSSAGALAALETNARYTPVLKIAQDATKQKPQPKVALSPVGLGTVAPNLGTVGPQKPAPAPTVQPPKVVGGAWGWGSRT